MTAQEARTARKRLGLAFVGVYGVMLAVLFVVVQMKGGGEAGLLFLFVTLPWPWVGYLLFGHAGTMLGFLAGFVLNGLLAFALGWGVSWLANRRRIAGTAQ